VQTGLWGGGPEGKRLVGKPSSRWEDNIKMTYGNRMGCGLDLSNQDTALVNTAMNIRGPQSAGNSLND
jgi:hypothetical protein